MNKEKKFQKMLKAKFKNVTYFLGIGHVSYSEEPKHDVLPFTEVAKEEPKQNYSMEYNFKKDVIIGYLTGVPIFAQHIKRLMETISNEELHKVYKSLIDDQEFNLVHNPYHVKYKTINKVKRTVDEMNQRYQELKALCNNY